MSFVDIAFWGCAVTAMLCIGVLFSSQQNGVQDEP